MDILYKWKFLTAHAQLREKRGVFLGGAYSEVTAISSAGSMGLGLDRKKKREEIYSPSLTFLLVSLASHFFYLEEDCLFGPKTARYGFCSPQNALDFRPAIFLADSGPPSR